MTRRRAALAPLVAGLLWVIGAEAVAAQPSPAAPDGVDAALQEFLSAFNALDMPGFLAAFADDAVVFHPPSPPPRTFPTRVSGRAEVERTFRVVFDQIRAASGRTTPPFQNLQPQDLLIQRFDGVAVVTFHLGTEKVRGRRTLVLRRIGATWRIVHLHASTFAAEPPG
ncbi:MAG: nuclear transport factor 2 family protein [Vicinamibacterales bacterium]